MTCGVTDKLVGIASVALEYLPVNLRLLSFDDVSSDVTMALASRDVLWLLITEVRRRLLAVVRFVDGFFVGEIILSTTRTIPFCRAASFFCRPTFPLLNQVLSVSGSMAVVAFIIFSCGLPSVLHSWTAVSRGRSGKLRFSLDNIRWSVTC